MSGQIISRKANLDKPNLGTKCYSLLDIQPVISLEPPKKVVVYNRGSTRKQESRLEELTASIVQDLQGMGLTMAKVFTEIANGKVANLDKRIVLIEAIDFCRNYGLPLVISDLTRLARPNGYEPRTNPYAELDSTEISQIAEILEGIEVFTLTDPEAKLEAISGEQKKRGIRISRKKRKERPSERRQRLFRIVLALTRMQISQRRIARLAKIPESTVRKWVKAGRPKPQKRKPRTFAQRRLLRLERYRGYEARAQAIEMIEKHEQTALLNMAE